MKKKSVITITEVGRKAGVHPSTVSRILNRRFEEHQYSPKTVKRVMAIANELGYQPSSIGRSLRTGKTMQVGLLVPDISVAFFSNLVKLFESYLWQADYRLLICCSNENTEQERKYVSDLLTRGVDGLIVVPSHLENYQVAIESGVPLVSVDRPLGTGEIPYVGLDNVKAGELMGQYLKQRGYENILAVAPLLPGDPTLLQRQKGLASGLGIKADALPFVELSFEQMRMPCERLVTFAKKSHAAIIGLTEDTTIYAFEQLRRNQYQIPLSVGLGGIDDFPVASLLQPEITVVAQPIEEIALRVVDILLNAMAHKDEILSSSNRTNEIHLQLEPRLLSRQSL